MTVYSALVKAVQENDYTSVKLAYLSRPQALEAYNNVHASSLLHLCARVADLEIVKFIFSKDKVALSAIDESFETPLEVAMRADKEEVMKFFLQQRNSVSVSLFRPAVEEMQASDLTKAFRVMRLFLQYHPHILDRKDRLGRTPLFKAVEMSHFTLTGFFLKRGANLRVKDCRGITLYQMACSRLNPPLFEMIAKRLTQQELIQKIKNISPIDFIYGQVEKIRLKRFTEEMRDHDYPSVISSATRAANRMARFLRVQGAPLPQQHKRYNRILKLIKPLSTSIPKRSILWVR